MKQQFSPWCEKLDAVDDFGKKKGFNEGIRWLRADLQGGCDLASTADNISLRSY
jgi:hypothetical protein